MSSIFVRLRFTVFTTAVAVPARCHIAGVVTGGTVAVSQINVDIVGVIVKTCIRLVRIISVTGTSRVIILPREGIKW